MINMMKYVSFLCLMSLMVLQFTGCSIKSDARPKAKAATSPQFGDSEYVQYIRDCSVLVRLEVGGGTGTGTGVIVKNGEDGYIWTAYHVVNSMSLGDQATIEKYPEVFGSQKKFLTDNATLIALSMEHDIALLKLDSPDKFYHSTIIETENVTLPGIDVYHVGNMNAKVGSVTKGVVSRYSRNLIHPLIVGSYSLLIETTCQAYKGSSGGGIFNKDGNIIGIVSMVDPTAGITIAISSNEIVAWAESENLRDALGSK